MKKNLIYFSLSINRPWPYVYRLKTRIKKKGRTEKDILQINIDYILPDRLHHQLKIRTNSYTYAYTCVCVCVSIYAVHLSDTNIFISTTCYWSLLMLQIYWNIIWQLFWPLYGVYIYVDDQIQNNYYNLLSFFVVINIV
jgi:hypothetical protein